MKLMGRKPSARDGKIQKEISRLRHNIKRKVGVLPEENRGNSANGLFYG